MTLRPWRERDLPFLMRLRNDAALQALLLATVRGSDVEKVRAWAIRRSTGPDMVFRIVADEATGEPRGFVQAERAARATDNWRFGVCLDWPFQGAGRGRAALRLFENLLAEAYGAARLELKVDAANHRAVACYAALGYRQAAQRPEAVDAGSRLAEVVEMARTLRSGADAA